MTVDERIDDLAETLRQLRAEDTRLRVFGSPAHGYRLNPPLSEAEIRAFEADHGIQLPEDYRLFLRVVGNGGPGPAYGLATLAAAAESVDPRSPFPFAQASSGYPDDVLDRWSDEPFGVLELCHHGCAIYSYLVVNGAPRGTIWDGSGVDVEPTELGFLEWYRQWADSSLRKVRSEQRARALRVGMSTDEVMQAVEGAWKKRQPADGSVTYFEAPGIPAQLEVDERDRVARIIPWQFL
ncbi:MAG TPA: SMI1/KNR4 family protein [Longimicrobium sp.]|nr:SMI1/KNR4 family protein [Longimicrobium sp.]